MNVYKALYNEAKNSKHPKADLGKNLKRIMSEEHFSDEDISKVFNNPLFDKNKEN